MRDQTVDEPPFPQRGDTGADHNSLLVLHHIPKTAGTTFRRSYLTAAFPRDQRWILSGGEKNAEDIERFLRLPAQQSRRVRIVAGHHAETLRGRVQGARFLTIVRDPVDRVVSSYLHALFHPGGDALWPDVRKQQMGLREFLLKYERPNAQSSQLLGEGHFDEEGIRQRLQSRFALVGYTEAFDQFVFLLHVMEQFPLCLYNNRLVRKKRTYALPAEDLAFARELNTQDLLLHQVVRAEFQKKALAMSSGTRAMMTRYLEALERFRALTGGDPSQSVRLDESVCDEQSARNFEFVFGRQPLGEREKA